MKYLISSIFLVFGLNLSAQTQYKQALGLQFPFDLSVYYAQFVTEQNSIDFFVGIDPNYFRVGGFYTFHFISFENTPQLTWLAGPGVQAWWNKSLEGKETTVGLGFGLVGSLGVQYSFLKIPLSAGINWQPGITLVGKPAVQSSYGGLTLQYILKR